MAEKISSKVLDVSPSPLRSKHRPAQRPQRRPDLTLRTPEATKQSRGREVTAQSVTCLKRPPGVADQLGSFCRCDACQTNNYSHCCMLLSNEVNVIKLRPIRQNQLKEDGWKSPLVVKLESIKPNTEGAVTKSTKSHKTSKAGPIKSIQEQYDSEIAALHLELDQLDMSIGRLLGSSSWDAEVILLVTTMTVDKFAYFDSIRMARFLECKGIDFVCFDVSRTMENHDSVDAKLVNLWKRKSRLAVTRAGNRAGEELSVIWTPQVLIDGVPVLSSADLQTLEDDGDLDYVFAKSACANCVADREASDASCQVCGALFTSLIQVEDLTAEDATELKARIQRNPIRVKTPSPFDYEWTRARMSKTNMEADLSTFFTADAMARLKMEPCVRLEPHGIPI